MADNREPDFSSPTDAEGNYWFDASQWATPDGDVDLFVDGKRIRNPNGIWLALGWHDLTAIHWNGKRPTRRQRIAALVRRVLRRKADV